jgi:hypothetical protein
MSFFDRVFQIILNEEQLQSDVKQPMTSDPKPVEEDGVYTVDVGECDRFSFIIKAKNDVVDVNSGGLTITNTEQIDICTIYDMDKFIESYRLMILERQMEEKAEREEKEKAEERKKKTAKLRLTVDQYIEIVQKKLAEEGDEEEEESDGSNYRDKKKELREEFDKIMKQSKGQRKRKKLLLRILAFLKTKKDFWGVITMERSLSREVGGFTDYKLQKKLLNMRIRRKKRKMETERENRMRRMMHLSQFVGRILSARSVLKQLTKLLGRKLAMKVLRTMARKNQLNSKNVSKLIRRLIALQRQRQKQVAKIKKQYSVFHRDKERKRAMAAAERINEFRKKSLVRQL